MKKAIPFSILLLLAAACSTEQGREKDREIPPGDVTELKLSHYRPESVYNIPETRIGKAAFPVIDMHSHNYARSNGEIDDWVQTMKKVGIEKTVILSMQTGAGFDSVVARYSGYPEQFEIWCGIDFTGYDSDDGWTGHAVKELERCHSMGAKGVGEMGDKGLGLYYSKPTPAWGMHLDDPALGPIWDKCAELGMPVSIHVADPIWMYEPMDSTNDGLMNAWEWRIDLSREGILDHAGLIRTLENAAKNNPRTTFIACHFANCSYDLGILGGLLDSCPNLWADISARYAETATIPRHVKAFYEQYQDRLLYGTDMGMEEEMYRVTFRILESEDEHFYENDMFGYHWSLSGFGLSRQVLEKVYRQNAVKLFKTL
jgi:predicted TIM-barrel fold metal-dependent hydrolase